MILDDLANHARKRVAEKKKKVSLEAVREQALALPRGTGAFETALNCNGLAFICEVKKASPSKNIIDPIFDYLSIAQTYEEAGADCVSCLTEPKWFLGSDEIFRAVRENTSLPMLRKDFTVDKYQLYEARLLGADAVLLICSLLDDKQLEAFLGICRELGLDALVEAHDEDEIARAARANARIIGVNNRDLRDFSIDAHRATRLRDTAPAGSLFVAESGIANPEDVAGLAAQGIDAVLVGEAMMRAADKTATLHSFRKAAKR